jgi:hypothetical protein
MSIHDTEFSLRLRASGSNTSTSHKRRASPLPKDRDVFGDVLPSPRASPSLKGKAVDREYGDR